MLAFEISKNKIKFMYHIYTKNQLMTLLNDKDIFTIDVIQFCNKNCSVEKVVVLPGKGKQEYIKSTNNI